MLAILSLFLFVNYLDRYALSILLSPIKRDLGLSDTQLGLLTGAAFALLYSTLALPVARIAEHRNRTMVLVAAILVWSTATALCGLAGSFLALFTARMDRKNHLPGRGTRSLHGIEQRGAVRGAYIEGETGIRSRSKKLVIEMNFGRRLPRQIIALPSPAQYDCSQCSHFVGGDEGHGFNMRGTSIRPASPMPMPRPRARMERKSIVIRASPTSSPPGVVLGA